jgi:hypothetical protein
LNKVRLKSFSITPNRNSPKNILKDYLISHLQFYQVFSGFTF